MAASKVKKYNYELLGKHDSLPRGAVLQLTEEEAKAPCFTNKLIKGDVVEVKRAKRKTIKEETSLVEEIEKTEV